MARPPPVRHLAAPLAGLLGCFRFWECRSLGVSEVLATQNTKPHKESARHAPNVVQWFREYNSKRRLPMETEDKVILERKLKGMADSSNATYSSVETEAETRNIELWIRDSNGRNPCCPFIFGKSPKDGTSYGVGHFDRAKIEVVGVYPDEWKWAFSHNIYHTFGCFRMACKRNTAVEPWRVSYEAYSDSRSIGNISLEIDDLGVRLGIWLANGGFLGASSFRTDPYLRKLTLLSPSFGELAFTIRIPQDYPPLIAPIVRLFKPQKRDYVLPTPIRENPLSDAKQLLLIFALLIKSDWFLGWNDMDIGD